MSCSPTPTSSSRAQQELRDRLQDALEGELELPLLSTAALGVLSASSNVDTCAADLAETLQQDPSLSGNVMRVVNSAAYAPSEPIASLQQAVSRLGVRTVCDIAVAVSVNGRIFRANSYEAELRSMWQHAVLSGIWSQELARIQRKNVEVAFLVGLLHDVGRPVVLDTLLDCVKALAPEGTEAGKLAFAELEPLLDEFHAQVGARVLAHWGLPESVAVPVAAHHDPRLAAEHTDAALLMYFADRIAHSDPTQDAETALACLREDPLLDDLGLYFDDIAKLWSQRETFADRFNDLS